MDEPKPTLPPLYDRWVRDALGAVVQGEPGASCADCRMCSIERETVLLQPFHPDTRCCTFAPPLPNFLVGRILREPTSSGRDLDARISEGDGVNPFGIAGPRALAEAIAKARANNAGFGKDPNLRCPYYQLESGTCGIWQNRQATCATFFCHHEAGVFGLEFWNSLRTFLFFVERVVAVHCLEELGFGEVRAQMSASGDHLETACFQLWSDHPFRGRMPELFMACAEIADGLSFARIGELGGEELGDLHDQVIESAERRVDRQPPELVQLRPHRLSVRGERAELLGRSPYQTFDFPADVASMFAQLVFELRDPQPSSAVIEHIERRLGRPLTFKEQRGLFESGLFG